MQHTVDQEKKRDEVLEGLADLSYEERLTSFIRGSARHWVTGGITVLDFRPLYTATVHDLQRQLAKEITYINKEPVSEIQLERIRDILHKYTNILRDFEFIHANRWNTHFVKDVAASRIDDGPGSNLQAALFKELDLKVPNTHLSLFCDSDLLGSFDHKLMQHSTAIGRSLGTGRAQTVESEERQTRVRMTLKRFAFAIIGGFIIVVPMLILTVGCATPKTLAVISLSIFIFAVGVAISSTTEPENLLVATAAYAAVLTALIGASGGKSVP
ncbi:hypothetical protein BP6252_13386 [Coleophoma cylindrospora]|uniref:DUF6594 domain-containing protein n=1 Tax=Coleophoma cylindrospora TaxID=1849047 RepID=A0A3D8QB87_9HELO|nr:hypothetical protein BP6252_13386 [Coleophoma cylindrospora]